MSEEKLKSVWMHEAALSGQIWTQTVVNHCFYSSGRPDLQSAVASSIQLQVLLLCIQKYFTCLCVSLGCLCSVCVTVAFSCPFVDSVDISHHFKHILYVSHVPPASPCPHPLPLFLSTDYVRAHHVTLSYGSCMVLMMSSSLANRR